LYGNNSTPLEGMLAENNAQDILSPKELPNFTIEITLNGNITLIRQDRGIILTGKYPEPKLMPFFTLWSGTETTWKFHCTGRQGLSGGQKEPCS